jgi:polyisoprenyl-teichoic acid--peptidoglycan teichoic acid transferase
VNEDPESQPRPGRGLLAKTALAGVLITLLTATTVASAGLLEVNQLVDIVQKEGQSIPGVENALDNVDGGGPQTILMIGSDRRYTERKMKNAGRSDTLMLAHLDPDSGATAVMSIPRDLRVQIPGYGQNKINAAFALGGPKLTLKTVRELLGIPINHIVEINFGGFSRAVNRLNCVYVDVDHRYYHSNAGLAPSQQYAEIDIAPGYQKMCGQTALSYVRYRHTDSDFVRAARQQDFLRQAKGQFAISSLLGDRKELVKIFARYTRTDIRSNDEILQLLKLAFLSSKNPVSEVRFPAMDIPGTSDLQISPAALSKAVDQFENAQPSAGAKQTGDKSSKARKARKKQRKKTSSALPPGIVGDKAEAEQQAIKAATKIRLPIYFPAVRLASGGFSSGEPDYPATRAYRLVTRQKDRFESYRMVLSTGEAGQYYGIQGTAWKSPPILDGPSETMKLGGRNFELHYDGKRLSVVAFKTPNGSYWVANTLSRTLTNQQMLAIAKSLTRLGS